MSNESQKEQEHQALLTEIKARRLEKKRKMGIVQGSLILIAMLIVYAVEIYLNMQYQIFDKDLSLTQKAGIACLLIMPIAYCIATYKWSIKELLHPSGDLDDTAYLIKIATQYKKLSLFNIILLTISFTIITLQLFF